MFCHKDGPTPWDDKRKAGQSKRPPEKGKNCHASFQSNLAPEFSQCPESQIPDLNISNHQTGSIIGQMTWQRMGYDGCMAASS